MKKIISFISLFAVVSISLVSIIFLPTETQAQNIGSIQSLVNSGFSFKMDLMLGDTDPDVRQLQRVLNADVDTMVATEDDGSPGHETNYFGNLTKAAVIKFQNKYKSVILTPAGLTTGNGLVNKLTRTKLNLLIGVFITYDSVGFPQNRAGTPAVVTPVQPVVNNCPFIEVLISIQAIPGAKANQARAAFNCASRLTPTVDLKVNGRDNTVTISSPRNVTISWTSANVTSCSSQSAKPLSGSQSAYIEESGDVTLTCTGPNGTVTDSVRIIVDDDEDDDEDNDDLSVVCLGYQASSSLAAPVSWVANPIGGNGSYSYTWSGGSGADNLSGTTQLVSKTYSTAGLKSATVRITSGSLTASNNCSLTIAAVSTSTPQTSCSASPSIVSLGNTITWTAPVSSNTGTTTYLWSGGSGADNLSGTSSSISKIYSTIGSKSARVTITSSSTSGTSTVAIANCIAAVYSGLGTSTPTDNSSTTEPAAEVPPGEVATVSFGGQVSAIVSCYEDNGSLHDRMKQVIVSPCNGSPVLGSNSSFANASSTSSYKFLWNRTDGHTLPTVGQSILGTANVKPYAVADSEYCENVSAADSAISSAAVSVGWLLDYSVSANSCSATCGSDGSTGNSNPLQIIGTMLFGPAFNSSGCNSGSDNLNPFSPFFPLQMIGNMISSLSSSGTSGSSGSSTTPPMPPTPPNPFATASSSSSSNSSNSSGNTVSGSMFNGLNW